MNCQIRPAQPEETELVRTLFREYQQHLGIDLCFQSFEEELAALPGKYAPPQGVILLAEVEGEIAGIGGIRPWDPYTAEVKRLFVRPAFHGRGLGRHLAEGLLETAAARGYSKIRLDTLPTMVAAIALYRRLGFEDIAPYTSNPIAGALYLELDLSTYPR